jgi:hypothetical protein
MDAPWNVSFSEKGLTLPDRDMRDHQFLNAMWEVMPFPIHWDSGCFRVVFDQILVLCDPCIRP